MVTRYSVFDLITGGIFGGLRRAGDTGCSQHTENGNSQEVMRRIHGREDRDSSETMRPSARSTKAGGRKRVSAEIVERCLVANRHSRWSDQFIDHRRQFRGDNGHAVVFR